MIDSHCHWDFSTFNHDRGAQLASLAQMGIEALIVPGVSPQQWTELSALAVQFESAPCRVLTACGVHPWWAAKAGIGEQATFANVISVQLNQHVVAIGECGMDGAIDCPLELQKQLFEWHVQLACELNMPLIIHAHKAHNPILQVLSRYKPSAGGVIHGFSGSVEMASQYWKLGFLLGVGGTITYERAAKTRRTVTDMPLESLLLETDAPDMPLVGYQGKPNHPQQLIGVARTLAELRGESLAIIDRETTNNSRRLFGLSA